MKDFFKILIFSLFASTTYAQQATEIDSKFLKLPRYADLTAITSAIPTATQGMIVYNIGTASNWYYNGSAWTNMDGSSFVLPYSVTQPSLLSLFSITNSSMISSGDAIAGTHYGSGKAISGTNAGSGTAGYFVNTNPEGTFPALFANTAGMGSAGAFGINNESNNSPTLQVSTGGIGEAGIFTVNNSTSIATGQKTDHFGLGGAGYFGLHNTLNSSYALEAHTYGLGRAGSFFISNTSNNSAAVLGESNGTAQAIYGAMLGTGKAGVFEINNSSNANYALHSLTNGLGRAGSFSINSFSNNNAALLGESEGSGQGIYGAMTGTGKAGVFEINNSSNTNIALHALTNGTGKAAYFQGINALETNGTLKFGGSGVGLIEAGKILTSDAVGNATWQAIPAVVAPLNLTHTTTTFQSTSTGTTGSAGFFSNSNVINTETALAVYTNGTGSAFDARTYGPGNAIRASTNTGSAGYFEISSAANINDALGITTIGNGMALNAFTSGSGNAIRGTTSGTGKAAYFQGTNALETNGTIKFGGSGVGTIAAGKVLTSDAVGNATWQVIPSVAAPLNLTHTATTLQSVASGVSGFAGDFQITNVSNNTAAFRAFTNGTAGAGIFSISNVSNTQNVLHASTNGTGKAAFLQGTNALETDGTIKFGGSGVGTIAAGKVLTSDAVGNATWQVIPEVTGPLNLTSTTTTFSSSATGTSGNAGNFSITNVSNTSNGISVSTSGTGKAIDATNNSSTNPTMNIVNNTNLGNAIDITGGIKVSGTNKAAFKITSITGGGGNTSLNILTIPNTTLANNINDILIVTHNYSPNNTYLNKAYGVFWTGTAWAIYLEDTASAMPNNITFNVLVIKQ